MPVVDAASAAPTEGDGGFELRILSMPKLFCQIMLLSHLGFTLKFHTWGRFKARWVEVSWSGESVEFGVWLPGRQHFTGMVQDEKRFRDNFTGHVFKPSDVPL